MAWSQSVRHACRGVLAARGLEKARWVEIECLSGATGKSEREVRRVPLVVRPVTERGRIPVRFWWRA
jgi:hypothetical protein